ncbi:MAG TPA: MerR family transcriptional regulator [Polyangia bacterium]|nr:MerR family transcriptional regulator [Polyangia bacterium]
MSRRSAKPTPVAGIPDKPFFKIGEAARLCAVKPYVLRYWETEFASLRPQKTRSQQRLYRPKDVELLLKIRHLLYEERFTIEGARGRLRELGHAEAAPPPLPPPEVTPETLRKIKQGLEDLIRIVGD